jgi:O-antigen ligase
MGSSVNKRVDQLVFSIDKIFNDFQHLIFGYGFGSFGVIQDGIDQRAYPHNIFLETWFELGLIGLIILGYFIYTLLSNKKSNQYISLTLVIFLLLNTLKSNTITDLRSYFLIFGLSLIPTLMVKKNQQVSEQ